MYVVTSEHCLLALTQFYALILTSFHHCIFIIQSVLYCCIQTVLKLDASEMSVSSTSVLSGIPLQVDCLRPGMLSTFLMLEPTTNRLTHIGGISFSTQNLSLFSKAVKLSVDNSHLDHKEGIQVIKRTVCSKIHNSNHLFFD